LEARACNKAWYRKTGLKYGEFFVSGGRLHRSLPPNTRFLGLKHHAKTHSHTDLSVDCLMIFGHWDDKLRWALPETKDKYVAFRRKPKGYILSCYIGAENLAM